MNEQCEKVSEGLSAYLDGELRGEARLRIHQHLSACPSCSRELEGMERVKQSLGEMRVARLEVPEQWRQIRDRLQGEGRTRGVFWALRPRWVLLAAGLILAVSVALWFGLQERNTDLEPYLGLYVLAAQASDVLSSPFSPEQLEQRKLDFRVYAPESLGPWRRQGTYLHKLHGEPVVQLFYSGGEGEGYCIFQQSSRHPVDFGQRETHREMVRNRICTKLASRHFNVVSWISGGTLFTLVATSEMPDLDRAVEQWIQAVE